MKSDPPTFWDGVYVGASVVCALIAIALVVLGVTGVIDG